MTPTQHANDNRPAWFDELLLRYEPFLQGRCRVLAPTNVEETYQEAVCRALANWQKYRPDGHFQTWLNFIVRTIAHERRLDHTRTNESIVENQGYSEPSQEISLILRDEILSIPEEFSRPVVLASIGYSRQEIADACNGDRHAGRWKLDKGRAMLRAANDNAPSRKCG